VHSLYALTGQVSDLDVDVEDLAEITLTFESGVVGSVHLDYYQQPPAHWLEINGTQGQVRWDNGTGIARIYSAPEDRWESIEPPLGFERNDLFMAEMRHFLSVIIGEAPSRCSLEDGIKSLVLTTAVHESARMGIQVEIPQLT
jgi:predicted dehydrogenase